MANIIPAPIRKAEHLRLIDEVMRDRLAMLPLDKLLIYLVDTVDAKALPYLAEQFDVLGFKGWELIDTTPLRKLVNFPGGAEQGVVLDNATIANEATGQLSVIVTANVPTDADVMLWQKARSTDWNGTWKFGINADGTLFFIWQNPGGQTVNYTTTAVLNTGQKFRYAVEMIPSTGSYVIRFLFDDLAGGGFVEVEYNELIFDDEVDPDGEYLTHYFDGDYYLVEVRDAANVLKMVFDPNQTFDFDDNWPASTGEFYALFGGAQVVSEGNTPEQITQQRRELIKRAIELHRYKGTPWSIREALRSIGFGNAVILEGPADDVGFYANGVFAVNGEISAGSMNWACFAVVFDLGGLQGITADRTVLLRKLINEYKNARSRLVAVAFQDTTTEQATPEESLSYVLNPAPLDTATRETMLCNGGFAANGRHCVNGGEDFIELKIIDTGTETIEYI